ncbi:MAG: glycosyltransferase [Planctomycetota bacterium]
MKVLLVAMGSMGDTFPFLSWGKTLLERGHDVTLVASGYFKTRIEAEGMQFRESWTADEYHDFVRKQATWSDSDGLKAMADIVENMTGRIYQILTDEYVPGETVAAAQGYAFGARIAQERNGLPLATVHLQPMWFRSVYDTPGIPRYFPRFCMRLLDRLMDAAVDYRLGPSTNRLRTQLGLSPAKRLMKYWWNSPELVLGMFPEWFNPPKPDWPENVLLAGFPHYKGKQDPFDMSEVNAYLDAGDPPLVFSQSSITTDTKYFSESAKAAASLGRRAVFLSAHKEQIPEGIGNHVQCFSFVPLQKLLPRAAAHIHHGGIGTIGHSLEAGIPQLTVPMVYDQPDNAERLYRLGISAMMKRKKYSASNVARALDNLLRSETIKQKCREFGERCQKQQGLVIASEALERLLERSRASPRKTTATHTA